MPIERKPPQSAQISESKALNLLKIEGHVMAPIQAEVVSRFRTPRKRFTVADVQARTRLRMNVISSSLFHELFDQLSHLTTRMSKAEIQIEDSISVRAWQHERRGERSLQVVARKEAA